MIVAAPVGNELILAICIHHTDDDQATVAAHSSGPTSSDSGDDDHQSGKVTTVGQDDGETSMTESAEYRTLDTYGLIQKLESER